MIIELYPKGLFDFNSLYALLVAGGGGGGERKPGVSGVYLSFVLLVFLSLNEEIASPLVQRSSEVHLKHNLVKDILRKRDVPLLVERITREFIHLDLDSRRLSLCLLGKLASWIDVSLATNDMLIGEYFKSCAIAETQKDALDCLTEIVLKGMAPLEKCKLIVDRLSLLTNLKNINPMVCWP